MEMKNILLSLLLAAALLEGCASTKFKNITTRVEPGAHYQKIIVHTNLKDMDSRQTVEDSVVAKLRAASVDAIASYDVFPQGSNVPKDEKKITVKADGFDAALFIKIVDSKVKQNAVTTVTAVPREEEQSNALIIPPNGAVVAASRHFDYVQTVDTFDTAHFKMQTTLVDTTDYAPIWKADSSSQMPVDADGSVSLQAVMDSYASALVDELEKEGVIAVVK
jgi:hypothetical protein